MIIVVIMKLLPSAGSIPGLEHVMAPDDPGQECDRDHRVGHRAVSEDRLAREYVEMISDEMPIAGRIMM